MKTKNLTITLLVVTLLMTLINSAQAAGSESNCQTQGREMRNAYIQAKWDASQVRLLDDSFQRGLARGIPYMSAEEYVSKAGKFMDDSLVQRARYLEALYAARAGYCRIISYTFPVLR